MKKVLIAILLILVAIQFIRPTPNVSAEMSLNDVEEHYYVPEGVKISLDKACRDCHSSNTRYPWYSQIQPVAWWLNSHIEDGKKHFNLSEFAAYSPKKADHKLEELIESQTDHWMPLESYTFIHSEAKLTETERQEMIDWATALRREIQKSHPEEFGKTLEQQ
ncbi:heme-binding domain-containing protein [Dyadobacter tibetensis]|uniref:heme-binding domain-containing protein n=1 Tax=Dyadobacter tibetensis TaxID=1211851 RepID=UPI00046F4B99|nr:heme-binding domain-containing protein [Dyadobacter tibetensis]